VASRAQKRYNFSEWLRRHWTPAVADRYISESSLVSLCSGKGWSVGVLSEDKRQLSCMLNKKQRFDMVVVGGSIPLAPTRPIHPILFLFVRDVRSFGVTAAAW
nr:hypothetical protein [Gammaproteobacteria bacterium]